LSGEIANPGTLRMAATLTQSSYFLFARDWLKGQAKMVSAPQRCVIWNRRRILRGEAMQSIGKIKVLFILGFGPIVRDTAESRKLYSESLGIRLKEESGEYLHTEALKGAKSFALWPLSQAAESCFGKDAWPDNIPVPQAWLEFDVDNVENATANLESRGYRMLVKNKKEPWGQTVSRFISPEGLLIGVTFTPLMRGEKEK
jgi:hypothetical protein